MDIIPAGNWHCTARSRNASMTFAFHANPEGTRATIWKAAMVELHRRARKPWLYLGGVARVTCINGREYTFKITEHHWTWISMEDT